MANKFSKIDGHPMRKKIIDAMLTDQPYRDICAWTVPKLTPSALCRYKKHHLAATAATIAHAKNAISHIGNGLDRAETENAVAAASVEASRSALMLASDPFLARTLMHHKVIDRELDRMDKDGNPVADGRTVAALVSADRGSLELGARLAGRLDNAPAGSTTVNQIIVMPTREQIQALTAPAIDITPEPIE